MWAEHQRVDGRGGGWGERHGQGGLDWLERVGVGMGSGLGCDEGRVEEEGVHIGGGGDGVGRGGGGGAGRRGEGGGKRGAQLPWLEGGMTHHAARVVGH